MNRYNIKKNCNVISFGGGRGGVSLLFNVNLKKKKIILIQQSLNLPQTPKNQWYKEGKRHST